MECLTEDRDRSAITWMKDGQPLPNHPRMVANRQTLQIFNLQREDYGMYQCFVARGAQEAQASSELRQGGNLWPIKIDGVALFYVSQQSFDFVRLTGAFVHDQAMLNSFALPQLPNFIKRDPFVLNLKISKPTFVHFHNPRMHTHELVSWPKTLPFIPVAFSLNTW